MYAYQFRLIVVGDSTVGKSSLLRAFCDGKFCEESDPTVGVDFYARIVEIKPNVRIKLQVTNMNNNNNNIKNLYLELLALLIVNFYLPK